MRHDRNGPERIDARDWPPEALFRLCLELVGKPDLVFHGSNARRSAQRLRPRQANDALKRSGNQCAVYATVAIDVALVHAVLNRAFLRRRLGLYVFGHGPIEGPARFRATGNMLDLLADEPEAAFRDGTLYGLDAKLMRPSEDDAAEWVSLVPQRPLLLIAVPAAIGATLLRAFDTVIPYGAADQARIERHVTSLDRVAS